MVIRFVVAVVLVVGLGIGPAGSAAAHDVLISSDPSEGTTLKTAPAAVTFTFDQPVQNFDPVVSLVGPDGRQYATGTPVISGNVLTGSVATGPAGAYTAAYRVVSADGHPVTGEIRFTLAVGAGSSAGPEAPTSGVPGPAAAAARSSGGLSAWLWIGLIIAALLIAAAVVVLLRRPKSTAAGDEDY